MWDDLLMNARISSGFDIHAVWILDMVNQGHSGILNKARLGDDRKSVSIVFVNEADNLEASWMDISRDLLQVVNHIRDEMSTSIIGVGHSIGATAL